MVGLLEARGKCLQGVAGALQLGEDLLEPIVRASRAQGAKRHRGEHDGRCNETFHRNIPVLSAS